MSAVDALMQIPGAICRFSTNAATSGCIFRRPVRDAMITRAARSTSASHAGIARAIEAFVHGFCFTRSFTHPFVADLVGPVWVVRDAPCQRGDYRREEWIAHGVPPEEVDRLARAQTRGGFAICAIRSIDEPEEPLREGYKALGYRLGTTEPLMVHHLHASPAPPPPCGSSASTTQAMADRLARAARRDRCCPSTSRTARACGSTSRSTTAASRSAGSAASPRARAPRGARTCSSTRNSAAAASPGRCSRECSATTARPVQRVAVLLASHVGAKLYGAVGYEQIGTLLMFTPRKR